MDAPKINEHWRVRYGEAVGKEYNIIVIIDEDKKLTSTKNWRVEQFKCKHKGEPLIVGGTFFVDRFTEAHETKEPRYFGGKNDVNFWADKPIQKGHPDCL